MGACADMHSKGVYDDIRIRRVFYKPGYTADHWCRKGHIIYCTEGSMTTSLEDGRQMLLTEGMTYIVGREMSSRRVAKKALISALFCLKK